MEDDEAQKKEQSNLAEFNFSKRVLCVNGRGGETPKNAGLMESGTNQSAPRHSSELDSFFALGGVSLAIILMDRLLFVAVYSPHKFTFSS